ncbi:GntR family transcriptional regulator [Catenovulum maritimum]|uniref:GntR family transcriptional regulator n=1 Tax=Catenovulum maritimum TaxID=1513271 RepID=A0A0J8H008_9ALTE|nr:GntR family transcriptional regulator [Catenovulum maritimum]KMT66814.1 GntR family transcriptional regulator [Catenovulum maritimum]
MSKEHTQELQSPLFSDDTSLYARVIRDISNGVFKAGDRLVTTKLATRYEVSVNPIREALKQLQGEGFVTVSPNSGARVTQFENKTMRDVFEILQLLDPYLMEWFVLEHDKEDIKILNDILKKMENVAEDDQVSFRNLDTQFHWHMYSQHYNKSAIELWCQKRLVLQIMHANLPIKASRVDKSLKEHREMMVAIQARDLDASLEILRKHISNSGTYWSRYF